MRSTRRHGSIDAADEAMRVLLQQGIVEIRYLTSHVGVAPERLDSAPEMDALAVANMIADTLHHVHGYLYDARGMRWRDRRGRAEVPADPPYRRGHRGYNWLSSLWQVRDAPQEEWIVRTLGRRGITLQGALGQDALDVIEDQRQALAARMTADEANALAEVIRSESPYSVVAGPRDDGTFSVWLTDTPQGGVPVLTPQDWDFRRRELGHRRVRWESRIRPPMTWWKPEREDRHEPGRGSSAEG